jgi:hypothetical protein
MLAMQAEACRFQIKSSGGYIMRVASILSIILVSLSHLRLPMT